MDFLNVFFHMVDRYPDKMAIVDHGGTRQTIYRELDTLSRRTGAKLKEAGKMFSGLTLAENKLWRSHSPPEMYERMSR